MPTVFQATTRDTAQLPSNPLSRTGSTSTTHRATFHGTTRRLFYLHSEVESMLAAHWATSRHPSLQLCLSLSRANGYPGSLVLDTRKREILYVPQKAKSPAKTCRGQPAPTRLRCAPKTGQFGVRHRLRYYRTSKTGLRHRQSALSRPDLQGEFRARGPWPRQNSAIARSFSRLRDNHWRFSRLDYNPCRSTSKPCREYKAQRVCLAKVPRWFAILPHNWETHSRKLFSHLPAPGDHQCHLPLGYRS